MTKLVLVRHGEPDYSHVTSRGFIGHGRDLANLTEQGVIQAEQVSRDERLQGSQLIISSAYTRALQTAAIISKNTGLDIKIELDLHEWLPDLSFSYDSDEFAVKIGKECSTYKGKCPEDKNPKWESLSEVARRAFLSLEKYLQYDKIIVVSHGIVMRQFKFQQQVPYCGIIEVDFEKNYEWCGFVEH